MFNAKNTLLRMLHSLAGQSYDNWRLILVDDVSDLDHRAACQKHINHFQDNYRVETYWNDEKKWEIANVLFGVSKCSDNDIICRIDADDYLVDLDALMYLNVLYESHGFEALWTAHRWGFTDKNISGPMSPDANPYKHPWVSSHLKTFRKYLINQVPYENFLNQNNELVRRAGDQAIYLPVLSRTTRRVFVPRVMYHYNIDEKNGEIYQTDDAKFQKAEADFLRARGFVRQGQPWESFL